jgi:ectoine hydroxylase-related dioxygenase (phytanoyl-CoA dioxygenase family)/SAM-dependent methyltransferase
MMNWASKVVNGVLDQFDLRLSHTSTIHKLLWELGSQREQLEKLRLQFGDLKEELERRDEEKKLLKRSQERWRADEPDPGLTWGVPMAGDEFVRVLMNHFTFEGSTIVEIGPGYGRILEALLKHSVPFRRYIGLEISAARVARLRDRFRSPKIEFREADILNGNSLNAFADLTFSSAVFEHLYPDFGQALAGIERFTRPGGVVAIDLIRDDNDVDKAAAWFDKETYMRTYSTDEVKTLFDANGFTLADLQRISFGQDILKREIARTMVVATKPRPVTSVEASTQSPQSAANPLDAFVHRSLPAWDPLSLEPPLVPMFHTPFGGLWTDLNNADTILAGKLAAAELSPDEARLVEEWRRDGFVILKGAVEEAAIDEILKDFERAYDGQLNCKMSYWNDHGHHIEPASLSLVHNKDAKLLDLHDVSAATQVVQFAEPIRRFLQILFDRPALAFQSLGFYYGSQQDLHRDTAFVRVDSPMEFVASWIALEDIQQGSGELEYYVGSHTLPQYLFNGKHLWVRPGEPEGDIFHERLHSMAKEAGLHLQRFQAKKGDVLIWSAGLMHGGSRVNPPVHTRKSLVTHYCPADLQPMYAYKGGRPKRSSVAGNYVMAEDWT